MLDLALVLVTIYL